MGWLQGLIKSKSTLCSKRTTTLELSVGINPTMLFYRNPYSILASNPGFPSPRHLSANSLGMEPGDEADSILPTSSLAKKMNILHCIVILILSNETVLYTETFT